MKVVHSFIPVNGQNHLYKEAIYVQLLSALLVKREYGDIDFYTNENIKKQVIDIGFPYTKINTSVLSGNINETFSIPKIMVFKEIKEPFIHIDADTFIYDKIDFSNVNSISFSHRDIPTPSKIDLHRKASDICQMYPYLNDCDYFFESARHSYLDLFDQLNTEHSDFKIKNIRVNEIPNMNIICVKDYESFNLASELALEHYFKNRDIIKDHKNGACYIEQLMIHLNLMEISKNYYDDVKNGNTYMMTSSPTKVDGDYKWPFDNLKFPLTIVHHSPNDSEIEEEIKIDGLLYKKIPQNDYDGRITQIQSLEDVVNYFNFNFYGVSHLTYYKWNEFFQALIIGQIMEMFGETYIQSVFNYFKNTYNSGTSAGEKLYEKLTGYRFKKQISLI